MSNYIYKKQSPLKKYIGIVIALIIIGAGVYVYLSPVFEKNPPKISFENQEYWNLKNPLKVTLSDDSGFAHYKISSIIDGQEVALDTKITSQSEKTVSLDVLPPVLTAMNNRNEMQIKIEAVDTSKWNFMQGNQVSKTYQIKIDTQKPQARVIANTYAIRRGGSAVAVVYVKDKNLSKAYISFSGQQEFKLIPFYKENYYAAIIGWDVNIEEFNKVYLIAKDKANNSVKVKIPYYIRELKNKESTLNISDNFINNASKVVLQNMNLDTPQNTVEAFVKVNRDIRKENVDFLRKLGLNETSNEPVYDFNIKPFKRLPGSMRVGDFADKRTYKYNGQIVDTAWHLGIDWASIKHADIFSSNAGTVIFNDYLGIYGNAIIIDHGLGLCTLYAHTSDSSVEVGQEVKAGQQIAKTGATGAVFGDHLHFGMLVQGLEVHPIEWMEDSWIKTRITDILDEAKKTIDRQ